MTTINERWKDFESKILDPIKAGNVQRMEMKRAFFAGYAVAYYHFVNEIPAIESEDECVAAIQSCGMQLTGFSEAVKLGHA